MKLIFVTKRWVMTMNIFDVAKYFLSKVNEEEDVLITHLKLQKLTYYAQAWHLALDGRPLFNAEFQAWAHGPVNPELFQQYRVYGYQPIPYPEDFDPSIYTEEQREFLDQIWEAYGKYDGKYLERLTHQEKPWKEARGNIPDGEFCTNVINENTMKEYYRGLIEEDG
jgi:uncharacterized phage-associated protein